MSGTTNDTTAVAVDVATDDLDEFSKLMAGKAEPKEPAKEVKTDAVDSVATVKDEPVADEAAEDAAEDEALEEGAEDDAADPEEDEDILKPKKNRKTFQERINELTRKNRETERQLAEALAKTAAPRQTDDAPANDKPANARAAVEVGTDAPHPEDRYEDGELVYALGEFDPEFIRDLTRFTISQENATAAKERQEAQENEQTQQAQRVMQEQWADKLTEAEADLPDLRPTIATLESELADLDPEYGTYLASTIMEMEAGPQVLYYLANNVEEAQKIVAAGPRGATLALGRLEARIQAALAKQATPPARVTTAAPAPARSTRGTGVRSAVAGDTDDLDAFEKAFARR